MSPGPTRSGRTARPGRWRAALVALLASFAAGTDAVAARDPHVGYVLPAGGRRGTTFRAVLGGQFLEDATGVSFSGEGVTATVVPGERTLTPKEENQLRDAMNKVQEKRKDGGVPTADEIKAGREARERLETYARRQANPAIGEFVTVEVTVAADAVPGDREIRLRVAAGLTNPLVFNVGDLFEVTEEAWRGAPRAQAGAAPKSEANPAVTRVELPAIVNGQIPPGGLRRYRFWARAGQRLLARVRARELVPYLADAVPGWFQATVSLRDAQGKEVAFDDDFRFRPDPVLFFSVPADGDYVLEVADALFRGREDFVYRITLGELPLVTDVFPLGGRVGDPLTVAVWGWNLPFTRMTVDLGGREPGVFPLARNDLAGLVALDADTLPEVLEKEPNETAAAAQPVAVPVVVNGRIDRPGDVDVFRVEGRAGAPLVAEVLARRLGSPLDSVLTVTDAAGTRLAFDDDHEDPAFGLETHHADSYVAFTPAADGPCFVQVSDAQAAWGTEYAYRLRVGPPRPDFALRVTPSSLNVRAGTSVPLVLHAVRRDGFDGEVVVSLKDAPPGFSLSNARVPAKQDQVQATLEGPPAASAEPFRLRLEGRATIGGREVVRPAVPADDLMQAFAYRQLVPAQELQVAVVGRFLPLEAVRVLTATPVRIPAGGTATLELTLPPMGRSAFRVAFELRDPPDGIGVQSTNPTRGGTALVIRADATRAKPGQKGNLIVVATAERGGAAANPARPGAARRFPLGALPAIPFEVVSP